MVTLIGEIKYCPRCGNAFKDGEEQKCRVIGCDWPWPTVEQSKFVGSADKEVR